MDTEQQKQHLSAGGLETESAAVRWGPVGATCQTGWVSAGQGRCLESGASSLVVLAQEFWG